MSLQISCLMAEAYALGAQRAVAIRPTILLDPRCVFLLGTTACVMAHGGVTVF